MMPKSVSLLVAPVLLLTCALSSDELQGRRIHALAEIGFCVGDWQGVAQPQRGSSKGAFTEQLQVQWGFAEDETRLRFEFGSEQLISQLVIASRDNGQRLSAVLHQQDSRIQLTPSDVGDAGRTGSKEKLSRWIWSSQQDHFPGYRVTLQKISEIRLLLLVEQQQGHGLPWKRIVAYGMTRKGHRLAGDDRDRRECLITGGKGVIEVIHEGKSWFVCCQGCRQVFQKDPAAAVAAYRGRLSAENRDAAVSTDGQ